MLICAVCRRFKLTQIFTSHCRDSKQQKLHIIEDLMEHKYLVLCREYLTLSHIVFNMSLTYQKILLPGPLSTTASQIF